MQELPTQADFLAQEVSRLSKQNADLHVALYTAYARIEQLEREKGDDADAIRSQGENSD